MMTTAARAMRLATLLGRVSSQLGMEHSGAVV